MAFARPAEDLLPDLSSLSDCHPRPSRSSGPRAAGRRIDRRGSAPAGLGRAVFSGSSSSTPGRAGAVRDYGIFVRKSRTRRPGRRVAADPLALTLFKAPGEFGAGHRGRDPALRRAPGLRRPHAAYFATRQGFPRRCPGRMIGVSKDAPASPPCAWPCRPASSTSAARRRRATSAPPRSCSRSWRGMLRGLSRARGACGIAGRVQRPCGPGRGLKTRALTRRRRPLFLRHRGRRVRGRGTQRGPRTAARGAASTCASWTRPAGRQPWTRRRPRRTSGTSAGVFGADAAPSGPAVGEGIPRPSCAARSSSGRRSSAATTPKRRCCATSSAWRRATFRSTIHDPAGLLHDEAQRRGRDAPR